MAYLPEAQSTPWQQSSAYDRLAITESVVTTRLS